MAVSIVIEAKTFEMEHVRKGRTVWLLLIEVGILFQQKMYLPMEAGAWLAESLFLAAEPNVENPFWRKSVVAGRTRIIDLKKNVKGLYLVMTEYLFSV